MRPIVDAMYTIDPTSYSFPRFEVHGEERGIDTQRFNRHAMITLWDLPVSCRALSFSQTLLFFVQLYQTSWHNKTGFKSKKWDCSIDWTLTLLPPHHPTTTFVHYFLRVKFKFSPKKKKKKDMSWAFLKKLTNLLKQAPKISIGLSLRHQVFL